MTDTKRFKTMTMITNRDNGGIRGAWPIAIDVGYSAVKVFAPNVLAIFPSFAQRLDSELIGTLADTAIVYRDLDTGTRWLVGESAQMNVEQDNATISEEAVFGRARYDDPMFLVLLRTGLALGHRKNGFGTPSADRPIYVQTGLPPKYLKTDTSTIKKIISGHHRFALCVGNRPEEEFDLVIDESRIGVMAQPSGTLMSVSSDARHSYVSEANEYFSKNVLIFDAGFGTLDIFPIFANTVKDKQTFPEFGMRQVLSRTIGKIFDKFGTDVSLIGIQKCLGNGFVRVHDKWSSHNESFSDLLEEACHEVCNEALEKIGQIYSLYEYDYFIVTGGTGAAWNAQIREKLSGMEGLHVLGGNQNDPSIPLVMSNVRGYYMYLYRTVRKVMSANR